MSKIQNEDIKSIADLEAAGGSASQLPNDSKIYVTANGIYKTLKSAIESGDLASSGGSLSGLADVSVTNPAVDQILKWNGTNWTNSSGAVVNAGPGVSYFLNSTTSGVSTYDTLSKSPDTAAEAIKSVVVSTTPVLIDSYMTDSPINKDTIDSGIWEFNYFTKVSGGSAQLNTEVYTRSEAGVETLLFSSLTPAVTWTTPDLVTSKNINIRKNTTLVSYISIITPPSTATYNLGMNGTDTINLLAGDTLDFGLAHNEGTARSLDTLSGANHISITRIK